MFDYIIISFFGFGRHFFFIFYVDNNFKRNNCRYFSSHEDIIFIQEINKNNKIYAYILAMESNE